MAEHLRQLRAGASQLQAFLEIASTDPDKYLVIDASEAADVIAARIAERMSELMERSR